MVNGEGTSKNREVKQGSERGDERQKDSCICSYVSNTTGPTEAINTDIICTYTHTL